MKKMVGFIYLNEKSSGIYLFQWENIRYSFYFKEERGRECQEPLRLFDTIAENFVISCQEATNIHNTRTKCITATSPKLNQSIRHSKWITSYLYAWNTILPITSLSMSFAQYEHDIIPSTDLPKIASISSTSEYVIQKGTPINSTDTLSL